jgi:hypothetical protein
VEKGPQRRDASSGPSMIDRPDNIGFVATGENERCGMGPTDGVNEIATTGVLGPV